MGEVLLALGVSGLVAAVADVVNGWIAAGYAGVLGAVVVMVLCLVQFARRRWPGLLFWFGAALGAAVAQTVALWVDADAHDLEHAVATYGAIGAVFGMLPGGLAADWWDKRRPRDPDRDESAGDSADRASLEDLERMVDQLDRRDPHHGHRRRDTPDRKAM